MTKIDFNSKTHQYFIDNEFYPSVTQILSLLDKSQPLMHWAVNTTLHYLSEHISDVKEDKILLNNDASKIFYEAKKQHRLIKEQAADIGTRTHLLIERFLKKQPYEDLINEETFKPFNAFKNWLKNRKFELIDGERIVWSKKHRVAGTVDIVGNIDSKVYLFDLKTSKAIYPEMLLQISAYRKMYEEVTNTKIRKLAILRLDKITGKFEWKEYTNKEYQKALKMFILLSKYWHLKNER